MSNVTLEALAADNEDQLREWGKLVDESPFRDVYFRPGYVLACRESNTVSICALRINADGFRCLLPLLIADAAGGKTLAAQRVVYAYSPYGYGGLLPLGDSGSPTQQQLHILQEAVRRWAGEFGVVCVVVRAHPLLGQESWFSSAPTDSAVFIPGNTTISVNLDSWDENARCIGSLNKGRRSDLSFARRYLQFQLALGEENQFRRLLNQFRLIYVERMRALGAQEFYLFPDDYYSRLGQGLGNQLAVGLACSGEEAVGGALFMADTEFAHYHLSATTLVGNRLKAATFMINEGAFWARQRGSRSLHLGGGQRDGDSLYRFKESFGGKPARYATLSIVVDHDAIRTIGEQPGAPWPFAALASAHASNKLLLSRIQDCGR